MQFNWPAEFIWEQIQPIWSDFTVEVVQQTDSTNTRLLHHIRQGQTAPCLLVAEQQNAGRGRVGKTWHSQPGNTLMFSVSAPLSRLPNGLSLVIGCAVAQALDTAGNTLKIKWPNDICYLPTATSATQQQWHKLAGILVETTQYQGQRYAVIGIGVNVKVPPPQPLQQAYRLPAGYLHQLAPHWHCPAALQHIAPKVCQAVYNFNQNGLTPWKSIFQQKDLLFNTPLHTTDGIQGIGAGIDDCGNLQIKTNQGIQTVHSGEVSVRPC